MPAAKREPGLAFPAAAVTTSLVAIGTFVVDRLAKHGDLGVPAQRNPGWQPDRFRHSRTSTLANTIFSTAWPWAELFGVALTMLIILFWGGARPQKSYSIAFGLILGALLSQLV